MLYLKEVFQQLGYDAVFTDLKGIIHVNTQRAYIHYDDLQAFCKLNSFKGIACVNGQLIVEFVD